MLESHMQIILIRAKWKGQEILFMKGWGKKEECDVIICEMKVRLSFTGHLIAAASFYKQVSRI